METTAYHYHCSPELGKRLPLAAGTDAVSCKWLDVDPNHEDYAHLYASHRQWVDEIARHMEMELQGSSS